MATTRTTRITATRTTGADRERSDRVGLFVGRGAASTPLGLLFAYTDAPPPTPATVATLPVGRRLLTATTEHDYRAALVAFATAWRAAGFGDTACEHTDPPPDLAVCPPTTGEHTGLWAGSAYTSAYTFDDGQVLYYSPHRRDRHPHSGQWHTITVTNTHGTPGGTAVELTPATRHYGKSYPDTADLDLPGLAAWLIPELTALGRTDTSAMWPHVRYAAAVNTARAEIALYLYGLDDTPGTRREPTEHDHRAFDEITALALAHNWTNPQNTWDRRFELQLHIVGEHDRPKTAQPRKRTRNGHPTRRPQPVVELTRRNRWLGWLAPGRCAGMGYLREHPGEEFGPTCAPPPLRQSVRCRRTEDVAPSAESPLGGEPMYDHTHCPPTAHDRDPAAPRRMTSKTRRRARLAAVPRQPTFPTARPVSWPVNRLRPGRTSLADQMRPD